MSETDDDEKEEADATEEACISLGSVDSSGASAAGWYRGSRRSEKAGLEVIPTDISREAQASLPAMEDMSFSKVEAPKDPAPHGRTPLVDAAAKGDCKVFCDVLSAMEDNLTKHQFREAITSTTWLGNKSLMMAAAQGGNKNIVEKITQLLDREISARGDLCGGAVLLDAARRCDMDTLKKVEHIVSVEITEEEAIAIVTARKEGQDTDLTLYARQYKRHIMWAWAEALQQHFVPEEMAEACTVSFAAICAGDPKRDGLEGASVLIAYGARTDHTDLIRLARICTLDPLKDCFIGALSVADNPFIQGMILSVAFDDAEPKANEREGRILSILMKMIDDVLLEVLERLPQTVASFTGGLEGCAYIFEPANTGKGPPVCTDPLELALNERQFTETFCVAPLVFQYLSQRFVSRLPDMRDSNKVLEAVTSDDAVESEEGVPNGQKYLYEDDLVANGPLARLMQGMGIVASGAGGRVEDLTGWERIFSGTILPGAQFVAVGVLTKPMTYYQVAAMRLAVDFVVHLLMLALYTVVVLDEDDGELSTSVVFLTFHVTAAIITELSEMWAGFQEYWQDPWNWVDVTSLTLLAIGLYIRLFDKDKSLGMVFYALSAPLVFSRFLFFCQIFPRQGLVIQMITILLGQIVHFGVVMGVLMVGFTVAFLALFSETSASFGGVWLNVFKAMLGEVTVFDEISPVVAYEHVVTFLLVVYLIIMAVMLFNLLIAVLSTEHAKVDERSDREYNVSKVRMMKLYRRVVGNDLMPAPFNLVQIGVSLPFALLDCIISGNTYKIVRRRVGGVVFWGVTGPIIILFGWLLWVISIPEALVMAWKGTHYSRTTFVFRVTGTAAVLPFHLFGAPVCFFFFWIESAVAAVVSPAKARMCAMRWCRRHRVTSPAATVEKEMHISVSKMLRQEPEEDGRNVSEIWEYLKDPNTPQSPAMRREEELRPATVEQVRLLRNYLETTRSDNLAALSARLDSFDSTSGTLVDGIDERADDRFRGLEAKVMERLEEIEAKVEKSIASRIGDIEEKIDALLKKL